MIEEKAWRSPLHRDIFEFYTNYIKNKYTWGSKSMEQFWDFNNLRNIYDQNIQFRQEYY